MLQIGNRESVDPVTDINAGDTKPAAVRRIVRVWGLHHRAGGNNSGDGGNDGSSSGVNTTRRRDKEATKAKNVEHRQQQGLRA